MLSLSDDLRRVLRITEEMKRRYIAPPEIMWEGLMKYLSVVQNYSFFRETVLTFAYITEWHHPKLRFSGEQSWLYTASNKRTILMPRTLWELSDIPNIKLLWEEVSFEETLPMMLSNDGKGRKFRRVISRKTKSMVILSWFSEDNFIFFLEYLCVGFFNYFLNIYYFYLCIYLAALDLSCRMWTLSCRIWDLVPWLGIEP